jgi:hypothetical protein
MLDKKSILASWLILIIVSVALSGCAQPPAEPPVEQPPAPQKSEAPPPPPAAPAELPPPKLEEVQEAVTRIFKDAVVVDASRKPNFLVGDFNGDLSQDLVIVLKPAEGKLSELNQEYPNWIAREPLDEVLPKPKVLIRPAAKSSPNPAAGQTVRFEQSDVLLAIIHGYGPMGWHDPASQQTHLLRDVVGTNMSILPSRDAVNAYRGIKPFPIIYGDLIQQSILGQSGFLHFKGGYYGWYDPKNFKPQSAQMAGHSPMATMRKRESK